MEKDIGLNIVLTVQWVDVDERALHVNGLNSSRQWGLYQMLRTARREQGTREVVFYAPHPKLNDIMRRKKRARDERAPQQRQNDRDGRFVALGDSLRFVRKR